MAEARAIKRILRRLENIKLQVQTFTVDTCISEIKAQQALLGDEWNDFLSIETSRNGEFEKTHLGVVDIIKATHVDLIFKLNNWEQLYEENYASRNNILINRIIINNNFLQKLRDQCIDRFNENMEIETMVSIPETEGEINNGTNMCDDCCEKESLDLGEGEIDDSVYVMVSGFQPGETTATTLSSNRETQREVFTNSPSVNVVNTTEVVEKYNRRPNVQQPANKTNTLFDNERPEWRISLTYACKSTLVAVQQKQQTTLNVLNESSNDGDLIFPVKGQRHVPLRRNVNSVSDAPPANQHIEVVSADKPPAPTARKKVVNIFDGDPGLSVNSTTSLLSSSMLETRLIVNSNQITNQLNNDRGTNEECGQTPAMPRETVKNTTHKEITKIVIQLFVVGHEELDHLHEDTMKRDYNTSVNSSLSNTNSNNSSKRTRREQRSSKDIKNSSDHIIQAASFKSKNGEIKNKKGLDENKSGDNKNKTKPDVSNNENKFETGEEKEITSKHNFKTIEAEVITKRRTAITRCYSDVAMSSGNVPVKYIEHLNHTGIDSRMISLEQTKADLRLKINSITRLPTKSFISTNIIPVGSIKSSEKDAYKLIYFAKQRSTQNTKLLNDIEHTESGEMNLTTSTKFSSKNDDGENTKSKCSSSTVAAASAGRKNCENVKEERESWASKYKRARKRERNTSSIKKIREERDRQLLIEPKYPLREDERRRYDSRRRQREKELRLAKKRRKLAIGRDLFETSNKSELLRLKHDHQHLKRKN